MGDIELEDKPCVTSLYMRESTKRIIKSYAVATNQTLCDFLNEIVLYWLQQNQERYEQATKQKVEFAPKRARSKIFEEVETNELISNVVKANYNYWLTGNKFVKDTHFFERCVMDIEAKLANTNQRIANKKALRSSLQKELNRYHAKMTAPPKEDEDINSILNASKETKKGE